MIHRRIAVALLAAAMIAPLGAALAQTPPPPSVAPSPPPPGPRLVVTYVEAAPSAAKRMAAHLAAYAASQRSSADAPSVELLGQTGRPDRMVVVERWAMLDDYKAAHATAALQEAIGNDVEAPIDPRVNVPFTPFLAAAPRGAFHMVMHIDVVPEGATTAAGWLRAQAVSVMAAHGALGFEGGIQADRPNHFALHEVWASRADYEAYAASAPGRELRRQISTFKGAPFDDIFYAAWTPARSAKKKAK